MLAPMRPPLDILPDDIAAYQRDGAVVLRGVLDAQALALLEAGVEEAYRNRDHRHSIVRTAEAVSYTHLTLPTKRIV